MLEVKAIFVFLVVPLVLASNDGDSSENFQCSLTNSANIKSKLQDVFKPESKLASTEAEIVAIIINEGAGAAPVVGTILTTMTQIAKEVLTKAREIDWKEPLIAAIEDHNIQEIVKEKARDVEDKLKALDSAFNRFNTVLKRDRNALENIQADVETLINAFNNSDSAFLKHTLHAVPPLFALAAFVLPFEGIKASVWREYANISDLSCKMAATLETYRPLAVAGRLEFFKRPRGTDKNSDSVWPDLRNGVKRLPYNPNGYLVSQKFKCYLTKDRLAYELLQVRKEIHDTFDNLYYNTEETITCFEGLMRFCRGKVEDQFRRVTSNLAKVCSKRNKV